MNDMSTRFAQDLAQHKAKLDVVENMRLARDEAGKSAPAQVLEIYRLGRGPGKLTAQDYYYYQLYDDRRFSPDQKARFLSERIHHRVIQTCCDAHYWSMADDKFIADTLLAASGFPVPKTQAIFDTSGRRFGTLRHLADAQDLQRFFASDAEYPIFAKPIGGIGSFGALRIWGHSDGRLHMDNDGRLGVNELAAQIGNNGYLFQSLLRPHSDLADVTDAVSTVRVIIIVSGGGPEILHTIWKIPARGNIADNFWRVGNMLAAIEPESGEVRRAVTGVGPTHQTVTHVPGSGSSLVGRTLPEWQKTIAMCREVGRLFHFTRYQSLDVALTDRGPVIVEVNTGSAFNLSQLAWGRGFLTDRFAAFLRECGYPLGKFPKAPVTAEG